jgi:hypothetical protein
VEQQRHDWFDQCDTDCDDDLYGNGNERKRLFSYRDTDGDGTGEPERLDHGHEHHLQRRLYDIDGRPGDGGDLFMEQQRHDGFDQCHANSDNDLHGHGNERERLYGQRDADGDGSGEPERLYYGHEQHLQRRIHDADGCPFDRYDLFVEQRFDDGFDQRYTNCDDDLYGDRYKR